MNNKLKFIAIVLLITLALVSCSDSIQSTTYGSDIIKKLCPDSPDRQVDVDKQLKLTPVGNSTIENQKAPITLTGISTIGTVDISDFYSKRTILTTDPNCGSYEANFTASYKDKNGDTKKVVFSVSLRDEVDKTSSKLIITKNEVTAGKTKFKLEEGLAKSLLPK